MFTHLRVKELVCQNMIYLYKSVMSMSEVSLEQ